MAINTDVRINQATAESGKFVEIINDTRFPPVSVTRQDGPYGVPYIDQYSKYAILTQNINTSADPNIVKFADSSQINPDGKLRVANIAKQWTYSPLIGLDLDTKFSENYTGLSAQSLYIQNTASLLLTPGLSSSGLTIRASKVRFKIREGVSHIYTTTLNFDGPQANVIKREGLFSQFNGIFFELSGSDFNIVTRKRLPDGTLVENRTNSSNFNVDKLDGTGKSGVNLFSQPLTASGLTYVSNTPIPIVNDGIMYNVVYNTATDLTSIFRPGDKATVTGITPSTYNGCVTIADVTSNTIKVTYLFNPNTYVSGTATITKTPFHYMKTLKYDFQGDRTHRIRFLYEDSIGEDVLFHYINDTDIGTQFITAPTLPVRTEIRNVNNVDYLPTITIGSQAFCEESYADTIPSFTTAYTLSGVTWPAANSRAEYPVLGFGLRDSEPYQRCDIRMRSVAVNDINNNSYSPSVDPAQYIWRLVYNPVLSGSAPVATNIGKASRKFEYNTTNGYVSGGVELIAGFGSSSTIVEGIAEQDFIDLTTNINGTVADTIVLFVRQLTTGTNPMNVLASINLAENI